MFGFGKKKKQEQLEERPVEKKKGRLDKLVMGAIIGVAVGSVVGMAVAPHKGSDTRKMIAEKGKEALEKSRDFGKKMMEERKVKKSFIRRLFEILFVWKKSRPAGLRKIPNEQPGKKEHSIL